MIAGNGSTQNKNKRQLKKIAQMEAISIAKAYEDRDEGMDVEMNEDDEKHEHEEEEEDGVADKDRDSAWISCLAASDDGQWLVSSDTNARVTIYNLDTLQVGPHSFLIPSDIS